jgi:hypothetical protein
LIETKQQPIKSSKTTKIQAIYKSEIKKKKVAIVGAGWFGSHMACDLSGDYNVTLFEKNHQIFSGTSGTFGVRIHAGPHYPRSFATRKSCRDGFHEMLITYPELCNKHKHSVYALGKIDADGQPPKVDAAAFDMVCKEFQFKGTFDLQKNAFNASELSAAYDLKEPTAVVGPRLREFFEKRLKENNVKVKCNFMITRIQKINDSILLGNEFETEIFDSVIDATGFQQNFLPLPKPLPFNINIFYQPCLALVYKDLTPDQAPISFIVMDGWFPCLMPYDDRTSTAKPIDKYIVTHGKYTILGSYTTAEEAHLSFAVVNDEFIEREVKPSCEKEMKKFWPKFFEQYKYEGWKGSVLAKIQTESEFRGSITFKEPTMGVNIVVPGKITNIFDSTVQMRSLIEGKNLKFTKEGYSYVKGGVLDASKTEITQPLLTKDRNTCSLTTFQSKLAALQQKQQQPLQKHLSKPDQKHIQKSPPKRLQKPHPKTIFKPVPEKPYVAPMSVLRQSQKFITFLTILLTIKKLIDIPEYKSGAILLALYAIYNFKNNYYPNSFSIKNTLAATLFPPKKEREEITDQAAISLTAEHV